MLMLARRRSAVAPRQLNSWWTLGFARGAWSGATRSPVAFERHIRFDGPGNFRDLGGYTVAGGSQVRWRTVFRSDGLETVSPRDRELMVEELRVARATPSPTYDQNDGRLPGRAADVLRPRCRRDLHDDPDVAVAGRTAWLADSGMS